MYFRVEVLGRDNVPEKGPVLLCVNHANSLVDGAVVQSALRRTLRPVARKRLFDIPITGHILNLIKAVPVYSRAYGDEGENAGGFERLYELVKEGELIVIFPEGYSHAIPRLFPIKTGAARMALGSLARMGEAPQVIPVGITYTDQDKFRRSALLQFGQPIRIDGLPDGEDAQVAALTERLQQHMRELIVNAGSWEELGFAMRLASFFELRRAKTSLQHRFTAMRTLLDNQHRLHAQYPTQMLSIESRLYEFDRWCKIYGLEDYQLDIAYKPKVILKFIAVALSFAFIALPLAVWGLLNSVLPYAGLKIGMRKFNISHDQIDTARVLGSIVLTTFFWTVQTYAVYYYYDADRALQYALSLPVATVVALLMRERRQRIVSNIKVFFLFLRKRDLKQYLLKQRSDLEHDLASLVKLAKVPVGNYSD